MKHLANSTAALLAVAAVAVWLASAPQSTTAAGSAPVQVVNTPLPIAGNVSIRGPVSLAPESSVALASGTAVGITSTATNPVFVREVGATKEPVHGFDGCFFDESYCRIDLVTVPAGKRLVIEHISGHIQMASGQHIYMAVVGRAYLTCCLSTNHDFLVPQVFAGPSVAHVNHQTLQFFDAGDTVRVLLARDSTAGGGAANFSYSGYLTPHQAN